MINTFFSALLAMLIAIATGALALLTQAGVDEVSDIRPLAWVILGLGSLISFLKDFQTIASRAGFAAITRRPLAPSKYYPPQEGNADDSIPTLTDRADPAGEPGADGRLPRNP